MKKPIFAPALVIPDGATNVDFYVEGLGATELHRFSNADGSIHVSELAINGVIFHLQQEGKNLRDPKTLGVRTCMIGLFVDDVDTYMDNALKAGAILDLPAQDYDYGYRQGQFVDPYGHLWIIEKKIY